MSAALQLPLLWAGQSGSLALQPQLLSSAVHHIQRRLPSQEAVSDAVEDAVPDAIPQRLTPAKPVVSWAFYRKHTENVLKRYLYASMQVGRSPNLLAESVGRGWISSRKVRTFEDALIFVLDVERALKRLSNLDRQLISRVVLQEYTQAEAACMLGVSVRTVTAKLPEAIDRLTESLVAADLLVLPD